MRKIPVGSAKCSKALMAVVALEAAKAAQLLSTVLRAAELFRA